MLKSNWCKYIAGNICCYLQRNDDDEKLEAAIAGIIERRLYALQDPQHMQGYEAWRITYQSSEQAARAAYALANELAEKAARYDNLLARIETYGAVGIERCYAGNIIVGWDVEAGEHLDAIIVRVRADTLQDALSKL